MIGGACGAGRRRPGTLRLKSKSKERKEKCDQRKSNFIHCAPPVSGSTQLAVPHRFAPAAPFRERRLISTHAADLKSLVSLVGLYGRERREGGLVLVQG